MVTKWKGPVSVDADHTLGEMMPSGGQMSLKFLCPLCEEESIVEGEVFPAKGAEVVRDSEVCNALEPFYCSCGNEFELTIWNNIYHPYVEFEGENIPKKYWYKIEHPEEDLPEDFPDYNVMQLTIKDILEEEAFVLEHKKNIKDYLKKIVSQIQYISGYEKSYIIDKIGVIFPIVDFLKKEKSIDDRTYDYYQKLYESSGTNKDVDLKESLKDVKESIIEQIKKIPKPPEVRRINLTRSELEKELASISNEKEFRELLLSILPNLGFTHCDHYHSTLELGKDIIAITYDNFGIPEGNVFVVKYGKIGKSEARVIMQQIQESSVTRYTHPTHGEIKINRIYSITNETYTAFAKDFLEKNTQPIIQMVSFIDKNILLEKTKI